jgi:HlyD family secretion protein
MKKGCLLSLAAILVLLTIALVYYFASQRENSDITYEYAKPELRDIYKKAVASGSVKPRKEVNIKPQVSGVVGELYVEAGQMVKKGQKLAKIQLIPSEVNINSAMSNLELAKIRYEDARRELERQRSVNTQQLDVQQAEANYTLAETELNRQRQLYEQGVISQQTFQQFELDAKLSKNTLDNIRITSSNTLAQAETSLDIAKQELDAARNNLQLLREGRTSNSGQVANVVNSTMDGMVLDVPVEEGSSVVERNNFNEGTNIAIVADMGSLLFEGKVDESDVGKLKEGMPLRIKVGAIDDETFDGVLEFIAPKGTEEEGTVNFVVKASIQQGDSEAFLRAGYSANADIILDSREQVIAIQERDITIEDEKSYVEKVTGDQEFDQQEVEVGLSDGIYTEALSGVDTTMQIKVGG